MLPEYALDGRIRQPVGAAIATAAPTNTYRCADGKWLCIAGNSDLIFARLMTTIGRAELAQGPGLRHQRRPLRPARGAGRGDRRLDRYAAGEGRRGAVGGGRRALLAPVRHRRLRRRSAFFGPRQRADDRRPADRAHAAPRPDDPPGRRQPGERGGLDRSRRRRAHRVCAAHAARWGGRNPPDHTAPDPTTVRASKPGSGRLHDADTPLAARTRRRLHDDFDIPAEQGEEVHEPLG